MTPGRFLRSCAARCALSGLYCRIPAPHPLPHRHERGEFHQVASPDQRVFDRVQVLERAASSRREVASDA